MTYAISQSPRRSSSFGRITKLAPLVLLLGLAACSKDSRPLRRPDPDAHAGTCGHLHGYRHN